MNLSDYRPEIPISENLTCSIESSQRKVHSNRKNFEIQNWMKIIGLDTDYQISVAKSFLIEEQMNCDELHNDWVLKNYESGFWLHLSPS